MKHCHRYLSAARLREDLVFQFQWILSASILYGFETVPKGEYFITGVLYRYYRTHDRKQTSLSVEDMLYYHLHVACMIHAMEIGAPSTGTVYGEPVTVVSAPVWSGTVPIATLQQFYCASYYSTSRQNTDANRISQIVTNGEPTCLHHDDYSTPQPCSGVLVLDTHNHSIVSNSKPPEPRRRAYTTPCVPTSRDCVDPCFACKLCGCL